jgi:hypothetical protein
MQTATQDLSSKKRVSNTPATLSKTSLKELVKPVEFTPAKGSSLERLLSSCCDCV